MPRDVIYLDANATSPPDPQVLEKMAEVAALGFANPGSSHQLGRKARQILEQARETIAEILGGQPEELIFTSGATESIHLGLTGIAPHVPQTRRTLALTSAEHPATAETARQLQQQGWKLREIPIDVNGLLKSTAVESLPWEQIGLIAALYANNETGVIQNLTGLETACQQHQVPLHVDITQAAGRISVAVDEIGAAAVSFGVHKCGGPRGIGGLFLKAGLPFTPVMVGGFQEASRRPGTEPVALAAGMAETLKIFAEEAAVRQQHLQTLRDRLEQGLQLTCAPLTINGAAAPRLPNTSNITFDGLEGEPILIGLDLAGVCSSLGSACASGSVEPSPVLLAMGRDSLAARSSLRFSLHPGLTVADIDEAINRIQNVVNRLRG